MSDDRPYICEGCRQGHYALPDGRVSNFPCGDDLCECWFCGPPGTPVQHLAALRHLIGGGS